MTPRQKFVEAMKWLWVDHIKSGWDDADHSDCGMRRTIRAACEAWSSGITCRKKGHEWNKSLCVTCHAIILKEVFDE